MNIINSLTSMIINTHISHRRPLPLDPNEIRLPPKGINKQHKQDFMKFVLYEIINTLNPMTKVTTNTWAPPGFSLALTP